MSDKYPGGFVTTGAPAGFSVAFDGSGDYLTLNPGASFAFGTGDFTIEQWIYPTATINQAYLIDARNSGQTTNWAMGFGLNGGSGRLSFFDGATAYEQPTSTYNLNAWNHCVTVRSGTTLSIFLNGTRVYTTTNSTNLNVSPTLSYIARGYATGSELYFTGYFSNLRVVKGTAVYSPSSTTLVTPTQLLNISGTSLLTCNSPTIIDQSTTAYAITVNGDAKVSNFTPFAGYQGFNPALGAAAGGVWTLDEAAYYQNNRQWPIYDPYFNRTTLMLHGNGTNGAQNNTFLDSSTNNFTITRNGNTTQGSFSPFSQTGWSYYNNGSSGNNLTFPQSADFGFSGAFTIEAWINKPANNLGSGYDILASVGDGNAVNGWFFEISTNTAPRFYSPQGAVNAPDTSGVNDGRWHHWAVARDSSNTLTMYRDGVRIASATVSGTINYTGSALAIGSVGSSTTGGIWNGYISNFRIVKGTAVYTSNFTPSTAPLTAIPNTVLLTCQDNRYVDNSANNRTPTVNGTPSVQAFSPFVPAYITPTTYSNWFDGTGDYLTVPDNANLELGSGDFTIECWINTTVSNGGYVSAVSKWGSSNQSYMIRAASTDIGSGWSFFYSTNGTNYFTVFGSSINDGGWHHVAVTRSGNVFRTFTDGVLKNSTTDAVTLYNGTSSVTIGAGDAGANPFTGLISNLRIVKGTALYTASFTPPTAPLTAVTNTQLLTCQSSTFIDNSANAFTITANGNTVPVTSPTPFPAKVDTTTLNSAYSTSLIGGSAYFDGSGDYLTSPSSSAYQFDSGNFTVEAWIYFSSVANAQFASIPVVGALYWQYFAGALDFGNNAGGSVQASWSPKANTWYHLAAVRNGSTFTHYINGAVLTSGSAFNITATGTLQIGYGGAGTFNGYMSGLRFVKGTAVYTSAFTPPTAPPTAITNTSLLLNYTNAGIYDSTAKNVLETVGNAQISTTQSKWGGSSMYFDGSGDALKAPYSPNMDFGTGDFTIECWVYTTNVSPGYSQTVLARHGSSGGTIWIIQILNGGTSRIVLNGSVVCAGTTVTANTWTHLAFTRSGTSLRAFNNGVLITTVTDSTSLSGTQVLTVGAQSDVNDPFIGYIDDVRITKGVARYTTNFIPPTSQLQDQ